MKVNSPGFNLVFWDAGRHTTTGGPAVSMKKEMGMSGLEGQVHHSEDLSNSIQRMALWIPNTPCYLF